MYNSRKMDRPRHQWRSREYGFVDMCGAAEAAAAVAALHGALVLGYTKPGCSGMIVQFIREGGA
jgi:hypothetical protein